MVSTNAPAHVVITGCSSGIGAALARVIAVPGMRMTLLGRDRARTSAVADLCRAAQAEVYAETGDVGDTAFMRNWLWNADAEQPVDMVIANAGLGGATVMAGSSGESMEVASAILATNICGVVNTIQPLLPRLVARGSGHLVLMGSLAGMVALPQSPLYSASKAAVRAYGEGLRRLVAPRGLSVTIVSPGFVDTPMSRSLRTWRPFLWDADRAALKIAHGIARRRREIAFPWPLWAATKVAGLIPAPILDKVLAITNRPPRSE